MNKYVALNIIKAQLASEGGKGCNALLFSLKSFNIHSFDKAWRLGYDIKDIHIFNAINKINKTKDTGFTFYVKRNTYSYIVYFNFKINNKRKQVSFHSFSNYLNIFVGNNHVTTRWNKNDCSIVCTELYQKVFT